MISCQQRYENCPWPNFYTKLQGGGNFCMSPSFCTWRKIEGKLQDCRCDKFGDIDQERGLRKGKRAFSYIFFLEGLCCHQGKISGLSNIEIRNDLYQVRRGIG